MTAKPPPLKPANPAEVARIADLILVAVAGEEPDQLLRALARVITSLAISCPASVGLRDLIGDEIDAQTRPPAAPPAPARPARKARR